MVSFHEMAKTASSDGGARLSENTGGHRKQ